MIGGTDRLDADDVATLARLQTQLLPTSLVSRLGEAYARSFFRYVAGSDRELLLVERDAEKRIIAGCVVSLEIGSLQRRLLLSTRLLPALALRPIVLLSALGGGSGPPGSVELVLLFTDPAARGSGAGARLVASCDDELTKRGITRYQVRTFADPSDPAFRFYIRRGFRQAGEFSVHGRRFALMNRDLSA